MTARLVLMVVFGLAGVHHARHLEKKYGTRAWGLPSWVWGLITAFSLLIGAILLLVAERPLKRQAALGLPAQPLGYGGPTPGYGSPVVPAMAATASPALTAPSAAPASTSPAAGWHPDPSGRHELRWWDGARWTTTVHDQGVTTNEP
jgi:hypothetical protein